MQAFILAAGLGTRLQPLTNHKPKALVEVDGRTLLEINIERLIRHGATRIVVNVHHFADKVIHFINSRSWDADILISDEREQLLDTGGAIAHAINLFHTDTPVLIHNVDILSHIDLAELLRYHHNHHAYATLAVSKRHTNRQLLFNGFPALIGWHDSKSNEYKWAAGVPPAHTDISGEIELAYSGIAVLSPEFIQSLPTADKPYPLVPCLLQAAKNNKIIPYQHDAAIWLDVGKPETLAQAAKMI